MLRLRQALGLAETDLRALVASLAAAAEEHKTLPLPARTYGQHATPTSWGAVLAEWGMPLIDAIEELDALRKTSLFVSLSGAAGTGSALGPQAAETRAALAKALGLNDPKRSWHVDRGPILRIADWQGRVMAALSHMAQSMVGLTMTGIGEIALGAPGASSTMPQKQNPVGPSAIIALGHQFTGQRATLQAAAAHQHQRDGGAWFAEWMAVPQLALSLATALHHAKTLVDGVAPHPVQMHSALTGGLGLIHAEALSFALAELMPRPEAQAVTKKLCRDAQDKQVPLGDLARADYPALPADLFDPAQQMGHAAADAQAFVARAQAL